MLLQILWHHDFGNAGAFNDLNIWERSNIYKSFLDGSMANMAFEFEINSKKYNFFGKWNLSSNSASLSKQYLFIDTHWKKFVKWQESVCKNVENGFVVLTKESNSYKFLFAGTRWIIYIVSLNWASAYTMQWSYIALELKKIWKLTV